MTPSNHGTRKKKILEGVKVFDAGWAIVGPLTATYLGFLGATVVTMESSKRVDVIRTAGAFKDGVQDPDMNGFFAIQNAGKYGITINLKTAEGLDLAKRLIRWADVVIENFAPGVMGRFGMDYESARAINPSVIYVSSSQFGQTGPYAKYRSMGVQGAALSGLYHITGWPDGEPTGPFGAYTDYIAPKYLLATILTALLQRRRTGKGQYIEQSQVEAGVNFISPVLLDYTVNGNIRKLPGNRMPDAAPHGAYRCLGDDRWCAIAVTSEEEWTSLCRVMGNPDWTGEERFGTLSGRKQNEDELDGHIEAWTIARSAEDVMEQLQQAGVPAGMVAKAEDLYHDPQLSHRNHFKVFDHQKIGPHSYDSPAFRYSRFPLGPYGPGPCLGQHNKKVCIELLGMSEDEYAALERLGVLE
jgi:benzylsuccinate CoA-transferase BbsF subunit